MQTVEKILGVQVSHIASAGGVPAHIRVMGITSGGFFTIRIIHGLRTDRVLKKMNEAREIVAQLIGMEVKVVHRHIPARGPRKASVARVVNYTSLPDWARGDWSKFSAKK